MIEAGSPEDLEAAAVQWDEAAKRYEKIRKRLIACGWPPAAALEKAVKTSRESAKELRAMAAAGRQAA